MFTSTTLDHTDMDVGYIVNVEKESPTILMPERIYLAVIPPKGDGVATYLTNEGARKVGAELLRAAAAPAPERVNLQDWGSQHRVTNGASLMVENGPEVVAATLSVECFGGGATGFGTLHTRLTADELRKLAAAALDIAADLDGRAGQANH